MAAPIDQLNFKVILNDTDFKTRINEDIALAGRLNSSLSKVIQIKTSQVISSTGVNNAKQMSQYLTDIANKIRTMPKGQFLIGDADRLNATLAETNKRLDQIIAKSQKAGQGMGVTGTNLMRTWARFSSTLWSVIGAVRLFTNTFGAAVKNIASFQQANANLATIMQVSRKEIETLTNDALMLGRTTEWTASQVTELQTALAKLGYDIPQIRNMQASVLQFATAVGAKLPEAANLAGASLRMFGMHSSEMQKALEILTASTNKSALDFEKLKVSLPYVGAIAHSIGFDIAQTASLLGVLTNAGLESSRAGTGLRQVLLELSKTNGKLQTAMGGNVKTFDDFVNALQAMRDRGLEAGEATKLVSTRASSALLILANGVDTIRKLNNEVRDTDGLLKDIQSERLDTLHGSTLLLKSAWEGLIQTFRDSAGPMKDIVDWLTKIVRWMSLAESRANRIAQGTKNGFWGGWAARPGLWAKGITGSDDLTKEFTDMFDRLVEQGHSIDEATRLVNEQMRQRERDLRKEFGLKEGEETKNLEEGWWFKRLRRNPLTGFFTDLFTQGTQAKSEQMEAMSNTFDAVGDYAETRSKEDAEIAAHAWLEEWRAIFDAEGEVAARAAMAKVTDNSELIKNMKASMEDYIHSGGAAGAQDRGKGSESAAEKARKNLIDDLKSEAQYLDKLKDSFERLEPYLGKEGAIAKMSEIFGEGDYSKENIEQGVLAITEALRGMGEEGKEAAESIEASWGLDKVSQAVKQLQNEKKAAEDAQKALEKYEATLRKWQSEDFNLTGTGFEYDINKVFSDMNTKLGKVDEKYIQAVEQAKEAHAGNAAAIHEEIAKLGELRDAEKDYVRAQAQNSLDKLAESYLQDQYFLRGVSMDHLGDKSLKQLRDLRVELNAISKDALRMLNDISGVEGFLGSLGLDIENLTDEAIESLKDKLPESVIEMVKLWKAAKDAGLSFDTLNEKIQSAINKGLKNLDEEEQKAIVKLGKYAAKQVLGLADAFRELGEASGNAGLMSAASALSDIADIAKSAMEGFSQGGWVGAIIGGVVSVAEKIIMAEAEVERKAKEIRNAIIDARVAASSENFKSFLSDGTDNIFGSDTIKGIRNAVDGLADVEKKMKDLDDWILKFREDAEKYMLFNGGMLYKMLPDGKQNTLIRTKASTRWSTTEEFATIEHLAEQFNRKLWDVNGNLNPALLKDILDTYGDLNEELTEWLKNGIEYANEYAEAMKQIEDAAKTIVGDVVADAADKIVDSWWEAGQAALDYADILEDVAKGYAKLIVQDMLMRTAFDDERQKQFMDALKSGDAETAMATVASAMQAAQDMLPTVEQALQVFEPYRNMGSGESNSVGSGIKSITEDTANLLASYINAIRSDVSYIRVMQERGWTAIETLGASVPTLNDYLNQVAGNTYDTARYTQSILSELQSVIGAPGTSGSVVRVEYA